MSIGFKSGNCIEKTIQFSRQVHTQQEGNNITCISFCSVFSSLSISIAARLELSNSVSYGVVESKRVCDNCYAVP